MKTLKHRLMRFKIRAFLLHSEKEGPTTDYTLATWVNLKTIRLSESSQTEKPTLHQQVKVIHEDGRGPEVAWWWWQRGILNWEGTQGNSGVMETFYSLIRMSVLRLIHLPE